MKSLIGHACFLARKRTYAHDVRQEINAPTKSYCAGSSSPKQPQLAHVFPFPNFRSSVRRAKQVRGERRSRRHAISAATQSGAQTRRRPAKAGSPRPPLRPRRGRRVRGGIGQEGAKGVHDGEGCRAVRPARAAGRGMVFGGWWGATRRAVHPPRDAAP